MNIKTITRSGDFRPQYPTDNQCKTPHHDKYMYEVVVAFKNVPYDKSGFIFDHHELDAAIQQELLVGSCEQMHDAIFKGIKKMLVSLNLADYCVAIKSTIKAGKKPIAHMTNSWVAADKYAIYLLLS